MTRDRIKQGAGKVLFVYDYFYPGYRAGGPIQSLVNLANSLCGQYEISVLCRAGDLNSREQYPGIIPDSWNDIQLPGSNHFTRVWYASTGGINRQVFSQVLDESGAEIVYLNGIFSYRFFVQPLQVLQKMPAVKVVICPRGMLQSGALALKSTKKKLYLAWLRFSGLLKRVSWHATNEEEQESILKQFSRQVPVFIASNIPKAPLTTCGVSEKKKGELRLVYLSLVAEKKNLLGLIEAVGRSGDKITLDIYGPAKDPTYFERCQQAMQPFAGRIRYKGDVEPVKVQEIFSSYDASALLTRGENFGHAIYESLSSGRPVVTSFFTPWNELEKKEAGWNVDISNSGEVAALFEHLAAMTQDEFDRFCRGAYRAASAYYQLAADSTPYRRIFHPVNTAHQ